MESRWRYIIGAVFIPCLVGGIALLDTHPFWAYFLFTLGGISLIWGIWPQLFIKSHLHRNELKQQSKAERVLSTTDKRKITDLMESVNALNDRMDRYLDESIYYQGDRIAHYQNLIDNPEFQGLWDKCSTQSAQVTVISPELSELVRTLLKFTLSHHRYFLREWHTDELIQLSRETDKHLVAIETFRKRIQYILEQLI